MSNIRIEYLYRDGQNFKNYGEVVLRNPEKIELEVLKDRLQAALINGEDFYAKDWGLPELFIYINDPNVDHDLHELRIIEYTNAAPTIDLTVGKLLSLVGRS